MGSKSGLRGEQLAIGKLQPSFVHFFTSDLTSHDLIYSQASLIFAWSLHKIYIHDVRIVGLLYLHIYLFIYLFIQDLTIRDSNPSSCMKCFFSPERPDRPSGPDSLLFSGGK